MRKNSIYNNRKKHIAIIIVLVFLSFMYLSIMPTIWPDSSDYYKLSKIIAGDFPFADWYQIRGPVLPLIINLFVQFFGDNPTGFLIGSFVFYLLMVFGFVLIAKSIRNNIPNNVARILITILVFVFIFMNPIVIGYYHAMLTEFVATTIAVISCWLAYVTIDYEYSNKKYQLLGVSFLFGLLMAGTWLLKQPYVTVAISPFIISSIIAIVRTRELRCRIYRVALVFCCCIFAGIVVSLWNGYICSKIHCGSEKGESGYFSRGLINGVTALVEVDELSRADLIRHAKNKGYFNQRELVLSDEILSNNSKNYTAFKLKSNSFDVIDVYLVKVGIDGDSIAIEDSLGVLYELFTEHPLSIFESYAKNYLASTDVIGTKVNYNHSRYPVMEDAFHFFGENDGLAYSAYYDRGSICWWWDKPRPSYYDYLANYDTVNKPNDIVFSIFITMKDVCVLVFAFVLLFVPFALVVILVRIFRMKGGDLELDLLLLIMLGTAFIHILLHIITGAIIDRYMSVVYPIAAAGVFLFTCKAIKYKKEDIPVNFVKKYSKILFVIPAYNESENIEAVIKDVKSNFKEADILVVNDCSRDNTHELVINSGALCLDMPFNVKYAMAVQSGIKYARDNDYGYVIQFDADGQHLAREAKKLYKEMLSSGSDIVIGSRFIKETEYKHSFFRTLGTKLFVGLIRLFSGVTITDPTSGMQCLNRRVIERYAAIGGYPEFPDANLIIEMLLSGYKISEVSVLMKQREFGESMHGGIWKPIKYMIKITYTIFVIVINKLNFRRSI